MSRLAIGFIILIGLAGCQTVPGPGWHNPNKPVSDFDYDFYNCRMMVLQTNPPQTNTVATAVYMQCNMYGNMQQCWQQEAPIYADQNTRPDPAWTGKIETLTNECVARQGWTHTPAASQ